MPQKSTAARVYLQALLVAGVALGCSPHAVPKPGMSGPVMVRTLASQHEASSLAAAALAREVCPRLRGQFMALADVHRDAPEEPGGPIGGRWWVRGCDATASGTRLTLHLNGVGWAWVNEEQTGFRLRQYVYFRADGAVTGEVGLAYDELRRLAWVQFTPVGPAGVNGGAIGSVETHANFLAGAFNLLSIGLLGSYADGEAHRTVDERVRGSFQSKLQSGFVVTYDFNTGQADAFALPFQPRRPFSDGRAWLANERQILRRGTGGYHVLGPFASTRNTAVDLGVISGSVHYRAECEQDVTNHFLSIEIGAPPVLRPNGNGQIGLATAGQATARTIAMACPWYLVTETTSEEAVFDLRVRASDRPYGVGGP